MLNAQHSSFNSHVACYVERSRDISILISERFLDSARNGRVIERWRLNSFMAGIVVNPRARIFHGHDWVVSSEVVKVLENRRTAM